MVSPASQETAGCHKAIVIFHGPCHRFFEPVSILKHLRNPSLLCEVHWAFPVSDRGNATVGSAFTSHDVNFLVSPFCI